MPALLTIDAFLKLRNDLPIFDVRTPKEFAHAHIPGCLNLPLFDNDERAIVGTIYKQKGKEPAVLEGLKLVGPRLSQYIRDAQQYTTSRELIFHCWRGGMRSESLGWLFEKAGYKTYTLQGGYRTYRRLVKKSLKQPANLMILGGMTGAGKTELLYELKARGEQVLDLEALAHHKGSAFGAIGEKDQPSTEYFENLIFEEWLRFDTKKTIWVEDESHLIGSCFIPEELYVQMRTAPVIKIDVPLQDRIKRLVKYYDLGDASSLISSIQKISKRLGHQNAKAAIEEIEAGRLQEAVSIVLPYYDKTYSFGLSKRNPDRIYSFSPEAHSDPIQALIEFASGITGRKP